MTEPDDGMAGLYALMSSPRSTLDMTMYVLVDRDAEQRLAADAARGVRVRVMLDRNREGAANAAAFSFLAAHGVAVRWAPPGFEATHEKAFVVDDRTAAVLTLNLTSRYYPTTRDFAVVDSDPADVAAIEAVFVADFAGNAAAAPHGADLVWSPGAQQQLAALAGDARRGVHVEVVMTASPQWAHAFAALAAAGVAIRTYPDTETALYIHAKTDVVDAAGPEAQVFIGSQNFTAASFDDNRELGVIVTQPSVVAAVNAVVGHDFAGASPWQP